MTAEHPAGLGPAFERAAAPTKKPTTYRVELAKADVDKVEEHSHDAAVDRGDQPVAPPFPSLGPDDAAYLGTSDGFTREQAVGHLLDQPAAGLDELGRSRLEMVKWALDAGVALDFRVLAVSSVGVVPVGVEVKRERKIGR